MEGTLRKFPPCAFEVPFPRFFFFLFFLFSDIFQTQVYNMENLFVIEFWKVTQMASNGNFSFQIMIINCMFLWPFMASYRLLWQFFVDRDSKVFKNHYIEKLTPEE